jgi:hypothetical protein
MAHFEKRLIGLHSISETHHPPRGNAGGFFCDKTLENKGGNKALKLILPGDAHFGDQASPKVIQKKGAPSPPF